MLHYIFLILSFLLTAAGLVFAATDRPFSNLGLGITLLVLAALFGIFLNRKKFRFTREAFYIVIGLSFMVGAFLKQFSIVGILPVPLSALYAGLAFCGSIGLLLDYAYRIRDNAMALIPALLALELIGDVIYNLNYREVAFWIYLPSASLALIYGILFIRRGWQLRRNDRDLTWKFIGLGIISAAVTSWEFVTYFPEKFDPSHPIFRLIYLGSFAWLLMVDITTNFHKRPELKIERQILHVSLLVIAGMYFVRFIFK